MAEYKALMLDLDGTTVPNSPTGMPSKKVLDAINKAKKKLKVCIVTGRFLYEAEPVLNALRVDTPAILLGGCQIVDAKTRKFIYAKYFEKGDVEAILEVLSLYNIPIRINEPNKSIVYNGNNNFTNLVNIFIPQLTEKSADEIADKLSHIPTISAHKVLSWNPGEICLSISHVYATKQHAIFEVARMLGIETHEMIGVGEGPNDFPLLMACGLKVAMGNAVEDLKAIADYVAPTVEEDGVADVIEKFVLNSA